MNTKLFRYAFSIVSLLSLGSNAMQNSKLAVVNPNAAFIPERHGPSVITHDGSDFSLYTNGRHVPIQRAFVDKPLRGMDTENLAKVLAADTYLKVKEVGDNEFGIELKERLRGGGIGGATLGFYIGKSLTYLVVGTPMIIAGFVCPPAAAVAGPVVAGYMGSSALGIEAFSNTVGLGFSIALGSATGPV